MQQLYLGEQVKVRQGQIENSYLLAGLSSAYTTTSTAGDYKKLPIDRLLAQSNDNKLSLNTAKGCIVIGSGVKRVKVSGSTYYYSGQTSDNSIYTSIVVNDTVAVGNLSYLTGNYETRLLNKTINVNQGDEIYLGAINKTKSGQLISQLSAYTWVQVEVVN